MRCQRVQGMRRKKQTLVGEVNQELLFQKMQGMRREQPTTTQNVLFRAKFRQVLLVNNYCCIKLWYWVLPLTPFSHTEFFQWLCKLLSNKLFLVKNMDVCLGQTPPITYSLVYYFLIHPCSDLKVMPSSALHKERLQFFISYPLTKGVLVLITLNSKQVTCFTNGSVTASSDLSKANLNMLHINSSSLFLSFPLLVFNLSSQGYMPC